MKKTKTEENRGGCGREKRLEKDGCVYKQRIATFCLGEKIVGDVNTDIQQRP